MSVSETERRQHGEPRAAVADLLRSGIELLPDGIGIFDHELRLVVCNRQFLELRSYPDDLCRPQRLLVDSPA